MDGPHNLNSVYHDHGGRRRHARRLEVRLFTVPTAPYGHERDWYETHSIERLRALAEPGVDCNVRYCRADGTIELRPFPVDQARVAEIISAFDAGTRGAQ